MKEQPQKKGAQAQKTIQQIQTQAAQAKTPDQKRKDAEKAQREKEKAASEQAKRETAELFKPVQVQKVPFGVDPKTVVCTFYKQGNCEKGKKCKFSHDLSVERKGEKKNLYQDTREGEDEAKKKDDMAEWDEGEPQHLLALEELSPTISADAGSASRETETSRPVQTRQPQNHHRQSLQILRFRRRRGQIRLVLDMSQRRRQMHVQTLLTARFRLENKRAARRRESPNGQITLKNTNARRLFGIRTA